MSKKTLYLVDGTSLCYRSFYAINLSASDGRPTGAIYGFYQTLNKIISKYNPDHIGICFDVSRETIRQEKFKDYKIQRRPMPDDLTPQIPMIKELVSVLGMEIIEKKGYEADDVIASLCAKGRDKNLSVVVVTSDKDLYQLIEDERISVYNYHKDKFIKKSDFLKEFSFSPKQIIDYLALTGDSSDNIPGVKEFGSIENIFNNLDKIPAKLKNILEENKEMVNLSKELVQLHTPKLKVEIEDLRVKEPDFKELYSLFSDLEFKAFLKNIPAPSLTLSMKVKEISNLKDLKKTYSQKAFFYANQDNLFLYGPKEEVIYQGKAQYLETMLKDKNTDKITYGLKKELSFTKDFLIDGHVFDTKMAAYLLDSNLADYGLENLVSYYLAEPIPKIPDKFYPYFIEKLYKLFSVKLKEESLEKLFYEIEMPLIKVLKSMQNHGVKIKVEVLDSLLEKIDKRVDKIKKDIFKTSKKEFNLNSPKQLAVILFEDLGIKPIKKTKTGYSTSEEVLNKLSADYPIAANILEYRYLNKLKTTYISPLIEEVNKNQGYLHAQFNQTVTQTGRLSSSSPNLQSIPIKGELSSDLRAAFVSSFKDGYILAADYSQIELRILAHLSGDDNLIKAFKENLDIHTFTATLLFNTKKGNISESQRNLAKRINFAIIYGMSSYGLSKELKISPQEAQNFIDDYFNRYPKVGEFINKVYKEVQAKGYVRTILGRIRRLPDINSFNMQLREFSQRQAVNSPIQGSCADLVKIAMLRIYEGFKKKELKSQMIMQIHDELIFDVVKSEVDKVKEIVRKNMEDALKLIVPVVVNVKVGQDWGHMEEI